MTLKEFLKKHRYSQKEFSSITGFSRQTVNNYVHRKTTPCPDHIVIILNITNNEVTIKELLKETSSE